MLKKYYIILLGITIFSFLFCQSSTVDEQTPTNPPTDGGNNGNYTSASFWITKADESAKLQKQNDIFFNSAANNYQTLEVDATQKSQMIDGFGFTLTGGSAQVINQLSDTKKEELVQELFSEKDNAIGVSYIRLSIGASDLNSSVFSYDDMPVGQTDTSLSQFSLAKDQVLIDMLKKILTASFCFYIAASVAQSVGARLGPELIKPRKTEISTLIGSDRDFFYCILHSLSLSLMTTIDDDHCISNSSITCLWLSKKTHIERASQRRRKKEKESKRPPAG